MTTDQTSDYHHATQAPAKHMAMFLARYAALMVGCGATCIRIEKNVTRIARSWGWKSSMTIFPVHVHVTLYHDDDDQSVTTMATVPDCGISFDLNASLSALSWRIADQGLDLNHAIESLSEIKKRKPMKPWVVLLLASAANAAFCRLFGGDSWAMLVVFISTLVGFKLRQVMLHMHIDIRLTFLVCAFVASVIASACAVFRLGDTPAIALGTSVLFLVPGIPYLNAMSDILASHYLCGTARLLNALLLTACLSIGLCGGLIVMNMGWVF